MKKSITANFFSFVIAVAGVAMISGTCLADIITPDSATSTTTIGGSRTIDAAIDGTLLSSEGTSGDILSETVAYAGNSGHWLSASSAIDDDDNFRSTTEELTFDLGGTFDVDAFHLWPYVRAESRRGLSSFDISFSSDGVNYSSTITLSGFTKGTSSGEPVQTQTFALQSGVTHIQMTNLTTFDSTDYIAVSELRFGGPTIPEPSTAILVGLGLMGICFRRRRK